MNESVREYEELMSLYLEGKCTSEQEARLAAWVGEHPDNAHEYHRFRNVWEAEHPAFRFESIDVGKVKRRILESVGENQRKHGIFIEWWKNVAAVLLLPLLILGTVLSYDKYFRKSPEPEWQDFPPRTAFMRTLSFRTIRKSALIPARPCPTLHGLQEGNAA